VAVMLDTRTTRATRTRISLSADLRGSLAALAGGVLVVVPVAMLLAALAGAGATLP
jgi:hypothetical protein